ncbi:MAG: deoxyribodipyrimidine photo-lyase [Candidatus Nanohaloarchaea archaeon]
MVAIVWIRRSMRQHDNTALVEASREHDEVIPFYIVDEEYFGSAELGYPRVRFWRDSLENFRESLNENGNELIVRKGSPIPELEKVIEETGAEKLYFNRDYTPYSRKRDERARELNVEVESFKDLVMFERKEILTNSGDPYKVYSYYRDKWMDRQKRRPQKVEEYSVPDIASDSIPSMKQLGYEKPEGMEWIWNASREGGRKRLEEFSGKISDYGKDRDKAWKEATSKLSPHLKFGTVSVRECFWKAERSKVRSEEPEESGAHAWQEELAWRDFYFQLLWNFPRTTEEPFLEKYSSIEWESGKESPEKWNAWRDGETGFPFVDAGMRQLETEGWMHNRLRMVVTSFSCKDLWLDWRDVHDYFSRMFVDAELSSMLGGIQWAYSIGTDAQPYFRVFNPWTQGEKYDPEGAYIREYVPELRDVPDEYIHRPYRMPEYVQQDSECLIGKDYPKPIVDHDERRKEAVERFEEAGD